MATINFAGTEHPLYERISSDVANAIQIIAQKIADAQEYPSSLPLEVRNMLREDFAKELHFDVLFSEKGFDVFGKDITFQRTFDADFKVMNHDFFEMSGKLQGKGIADDVMRLSSNVAGKLGVQNINLEANLDVGGYAWIRRGAVPPNFATGKAADIFGKSLRGNTDEFFKVFDALPEDLNSRLAFVMGDDFRKYKSHFLGAHYDSTFDMTNDAVRASLTGGRKAALEMLKNAPQTTINAKLHDELYKMAIRLDGFARGLSNDAYQFLADSNADMDNAFMRAFREMDGVAAGSPQWRKIVAEYEKEIEAIRLEAWEKVPPVLIDDMGTLAGSVNMAYAHIVRSVIPAQLNVKVMPANYLNALVKTQPFEGRTLKEWLDRQEDVDIDRIVKNAKVALSKGETLSQATRRMEAAYSGTRAQLEAITRTVCNGIQSEIRQEFTRKNRDELGIKTEIYNATLDGRTTFECASYDGQEFKIGEGPQPPLHFGCRSNRVMKVGFEHWVNRGFDVTTEKKFFREFLRENQLDKLGIEKSADLPRGYKTKWSESLRQQRRALVGTVPAQKSFAAWFKNVDKDFQKEYLGEQRYRLYEAGRIDIKNLTDKNGRVIPVKELVDRYGTTTTN